MIDRQPSCRCGRGRASIAPGAGAATCLGLLVLIWFLSACTAVDREQVRSYSRAFDEARDLAVATLAEAEVAAQTEGLDLGEDLAVRRKVLAVVAAYNALLLHHAEGGDPDDAARDAVRLAESLASIAGAALVPLAGELAAFARPIGLLITRVDDLIARRRFGEIVEHAGPLVEELLELLAEDGPALGAIIVGPIWRRQNDAFAEFVDVGFKFRKAAVGHGDDEMVASLLIRLNELRESAVLPPGVAPLPSIEIPPGDSQGDVDEQLLRSFLDRAESCAVLLGRYSEQLAAQHELTHRYSETLLAAREAARALREGAKRGPDASAAIEAIIEHVRFFRQAHEAYQEAKS